MDKTYNTIDIIEKRKT